jgi:anaerobic magnesium-protoporphyrin IX monomethyl ester cyclase
MTETAGLKPLKKIFCLVPPTGRFIREDRCQTPIEKLKTVALRPPIDLLYAASSFEVAGCEVWLKDYPGEEHVWSHLESDIRDFRPDAILLSITTPSLDQDLKAATLAKKINPETLTLAKGAHFNLKDRETMEQFPDMDGVLRGEYENTCRELGEGRSLSGIKGLTWRSGDEIIQNEARGYESHLDEFPFPARHLTRNDLYIRPDTGELQTTLVTNRGCPHTCIYCLAQQVSGSKNRYRSEENVVAEIRECVEQYGIRNFLFRSDLFTQNKKWVIRLCKAILDANLDIQWACNSRVDTLNPEVLKWMRNAGCWIVAMGVESGDQETLDRLDKKAKVEDSYAAVRMLREAGIRSSVYLLMGLPWDTDELIDKQLKYAKDLDPDFLEIFYVYPFPGTRLYEIAVEEGLIRDGDIPKAAYADPSMPGKFLSTVEFARLRKKILRKYYLRPAIISRTLKGIGSLRELGGYIKAGIGQLK